MLTNYYIYCITPEINENIVCELKGYDNQEIVTVYYRDICACTSKTNASSLEPNLENLQCHENATRISEACFNFNRAFEKINGKASNEEN